MSENARMFLRKETAEQDRVTEPLVQRSLITRTGEGTDQADGEERKCMRKKKKRRKRRGRFPVLKRERGLDGEVRRIGIRRCMRSGKDFCYCYYLARARD